MLLQLSILSRSIPDSEQTKREAKNRISENMVERFMLHIMVKKGNIEPDDVNWTMITK